MSETLSFECDFRLGNSGRGVAKRYSGEVAPTPPAPGRTPRIAKQMALAIKLEGLVRSGAVADYAELARLGHVTRARMSQIMNLLMLAADIQEEILFLPRITVGKDRIRLRTLQPIALTPDWVEQRILWRELRAARNPSK
jgi:hypothetical protein